MPLTRKSASTPVQATTLDSPTEQKTPVGVVSKSFREKGSKQKIDKSKQTKDDTTLSAKPTVDMSTRSRRQVGTNLETVTAESSVKARNQSKGNTKEIQRAQRASYHEVDNKGMGMAGKMENESKKKTDKGTKITDRGIKRSSEEDSSQNIDKKQKLVSGGMSNNGVGETISPRRSSRTSIPNSRYRDMEEEKPSRRKKSATTGKEKPKSKKIQALYTTGIKVSETESESEDIVTEEIPIDTSQAMDALASSNTEISVDSTQAMDTVTSSVEVSGDASPKIDLIAASDAAIPIQNTAMIEDIGSSNIEKSADTSKSRNYVRPKQGNISVKVGSQEVTRAEVKITKRLENTKNAGSVKGHVSLLPAIKKTPIAISMNAETVLPKVIVIDPMAESDGCSPNKNPTANVTETKKPTPVVKRRFLEIDTHSLRRISSVTTGQVVHVPRIKPGKFDSIKEMDGGKGSKIETINTDKQYGTKDNDSEERNKTDTDEKDSNKIERSTIFNNIAESKSASEVTEKDETKFETVVTEVQTEDNDQNTECDQITETSTNLIDSCSEDQDATNTEQTGESKCGTEYLHSFADTCSENQDVANLNQSGENSSSLQATMDKETVSAVAQDTLKLHELEEENDMEQTLSSVLGHKVQIFKVNLNKELENINEQVNHVTIDNKETENPKGSEEVTVISGLDQQVLLAGANKELQETAMDVVESIPADSLFTDIEVGASEDTNAESDKTENSVFVSTECGAPYIEVTNNDLYVQDTLSTTANVVNTSHKDSTKTFQNAFCEVIEYEGKRRSALPQQVPPLQTAFDYIMFGDNLVEIRKPHLLHGRVQAPKKEDSTGQVEFVVMHEPESSVTASVSQSEDATTVSDLSDSTNKQLQERLSTIPMANQNHTVKTQQFATHGHIVRPDPNAPPTELVEISEDAFQKEIIVEVEKELPTLPNIIRVPADQDPNSRQRTNIVSADHRNHSSTSTDTSAATVVYCPASTNTEVDFSEITKAAADSQDQKHETATTFKKSSVVEGKIVVVGKDYLKERRDVTSALEYQVLKVKKPGDRLIDKTSSIPTRTVRINNGVVTEVTDASVGGDEERFAGDEVDSDGESDQDVATSWSEFPSESRPAAGDSEQGDENVVVIHPGKVTPIHSVGQKLATAGTQTPIATKPIYRGRDSKDTVTEGIQTVLINADELEEGETSERTTTEQIIIVHLPEGTEIKRKEVKPPVNYKQYNEPEITMLENGQYICVDCHYVTAKRSNWFKHRRKHLGIKPHQCPMCSYKAATSSNLKRHIAIHQDIRNFICPICSLAFRQKIHLERHLKYRHEEKKVKCPLCEYTCANENPDLKIHIKRRHMPLPDGSVLPFTCDECGIMTVSKKDLRQHKKFHKKGPELKLFCEFCSFVTDCDSRLKRHMYIHTKEKPFQCGLCAYRATQKEHVLRHMKSQHDIEVTKKKKVSLLTKKDKEDDADSGDSDAEGKTLFDQADYSSNDRIFACNHCTMRFAKLINLYKHLYSQHKSLMPDPNSSDFQCVVCEFRTNNKKNLLVHMRKHNMQDQTPPSHVYSCVLCRYINPRRRNLFQHMKKKHGLEIMVKDDGTNCFVSTDNSQVILGDQGGATMSLADLVTSQSVDCDVTRSADDEENALQIVSEDNAAAVQIITEDHTNTTGNISVENVINIEDMASYIVNPTTQGIGVESGSVDSSPHFQVQTQTVFPSSIAEHEAAEAIEGLQALAQQAGLLESQTIETVDESEIIAGEIVDTGEIISQQEVMSDSQEVMSQQEVMPDSQEVTSESLGEVEDGIELSSEQINQLSQGDYVEINGEVYKVEIASDTPIFTK